MVVILSYTCIFIFDGVYIAGQSLKDLGLGRSWCDRCFHGFYFFHLRKGKGQYQPMSFMCTIVCHPAQHPLHCGGSVLLCGLMGLSQVTGPCQIPKLLGLMDPAFTMQIGTWPWAMQPRICWTHHSSSMTWIKRPRFLWAPTPGAHGTSTYYTGGSKNLSQEIQVHWTLYPRDHGPNTVVIIFYFCIILFP